jgi:hypothetical protein
MDLEEYRTRGTERRARALGGAATCTGVADLVGHWYLLDKVQQVALDLPWHGGVTLAGVGAATAGVTYWTRQRRNTPHAHNMRALHAGEWAGARDRRRTVGLAAARRLAAIARPDLNPAQRLFARPSEVGIEVGITISGPATARGHRIVIPWETGGALVLGEPGARKSTFLAGVATRAPGAQVVVSTKPELLNATWAARAARGPVAAFMPLSSGSLPPGVHPMRISMVLGCRNPVVARQRATALMQAVEKAGLAGSGFWEGKGRAVITALLAAADFAGASLREVGRWLYEEKFHDAAAILAQHPAEVEDAMVSTLRQMTGSAAANTAGSVAQTASAVFEFLQDGRITNALDVPREEAWDLVSFIRAQGTLYMVTDNNPVLGPVMSMLWDDVIQSAKLVAVEQAAGRPQPRLTKPLLLTVDEVDKTMPGVPLDAHVAELRGWGMFILAATQNRTRLAMVWGRDGADALCGSMQTHVVLSINNQQDRELYERRIGSRRVEVVRESHSSPATLATKLWGNPAREGHSRNLASDVEHRPLWRAEMWSWLDLGQAIVVPTRGACAVVKLANGWKIADAASKKASLAAQVAEQAERVAAEQARAAAQQAAARHWAGQPAADAAFSSGQRAADQGPDTQSWVAPQSGPSSGPYPAPQLGGQPSGSHPAPDYGGQQWTSQGEQTPPHGTPNPYQNGQQQW